MWAGSKCVWAGSTAVMTVMMFLLTGGASSQQFNRRVYYNIKTVIFLYGVWCMADNCVFMFMVHDKKNKYGFIKLCGVCFY